ncbi:LOW QUALITY PROTEIN: hypothetical protein H109_03295 [Trichophyton interdigitale MR816]|uniref:Uncharacterized protein n=1 Tax=Trichophyton interdigitale (strain MR816) TaxID=1215338 RepID=A0A059JAI7_TRIIM|nr:LOW QUALITY PROTEIN: hypothetical protein H101_00908 [Trichophyton interdigitale H6]KDB24865.1 LOW QUALITY PROTEIN: hypothetical protein H109_03295 [Trichophyton interdigitale MR816]
MLRWTWAAFTRAPVTRLQFPRGGFEVVPVSSILEEEGYGMLKAGHYCSINIDDVYSSYRVLARIRLDVNRLAGSEHSLRRLSCIIENIHARNHDRTCEREVRTYKGIERVNQPHPGRRHVRRAVEMFPIERNGGKEHEFLVQAPLWDN